jgi:hypothetical protein
VAVNRTDLSVSLQNAAATRRPADDNAYKQHAACNLLRTTPRANLVSQHKLVCLQLLHAPPQALHGDIAVTDHPVPLHQLHTQLVSHNPCVCQLLLQGLDLCLQGCHVRGICCLLCLEPLVAAGQDVDFSTQLHLGLQVHTNTKQ